MCRVFVQFSETVLHFLVQVSNATSIEEDPRGGTLKMSHVSENVPLYTGV